MVVDVYCGLSVPWEVGGLIKSNPPSPLCLLLKLTYYLLLFSLSSLKQTDQTGRQIDTQSVWRVKAGVYDDSLVKINALLLSTV